MDHKPSSLQTPSRVLACLVMLPALSWATTHQQGAHRERPAGALQTEVRIEHEHAIRIAAPISGRIKTLFVKAGERFRAGAVLAEFDCERAELQRRVSQIDLELATQFQQAQHRLEQVGANSSLEALSATRERDEAHRDVRKWERYLAQCKIIADKAGTMQQVHASRYQELRIGQPIADIVTKSRPTIMMQVPAHWASLLRPGMPLMIITSNPSRRTPATISRLGAVVDADTQTLSVEARFSGRLTPPPQSTFGVAVIQSAAAAIASK